MMNKNKIPFPYDISEMFGQAKDNGIIFGQAYNQYCTSAQLPQLSEQRICSYKHISFR